MIIKTKDAIFKMRTAGQYLAQMFEMLQQEVVRSDVTTGYVDAWIEKYLQSKNMVSQSKGYMGYKHVSCISVNSEVVHGVPSEYTILKKGDILKVDVCASWKGYCADMARSFVVDNVEISSDKVKFIECAQNSLDAGINQALVGNRLYDISYAIQHAIESQGYGIVQEFAGHAIGKKMHENPDVPNYGEKGTGMRLRAGMTFAIEPMLTMGKREIYILEDGWTVKTKDGSLAMHVEDTVLITEHGPDILTRLHS